MLGGVGRSGAILSKHDTGISRRTGREVREERARELVVREDGREVRGREDVGEREGRRGNGEAAVAAARAARGEDLAQAAEGVALRAAYGCASEPRRRAGQHAAHTQQRRRR